MPVQDEQRDRAHRPRDQEEGRRPSRTANSTLMLLTARLKYVAEYEWGKRRNLDISKPKEMDELKGKAEG